MICAGDQRHHAQQVEDRLPEAISRAIVGLGKAFRDYEQKNEAQWLSLLGREAPIEAR